MGLFSALFTGVSALFAQSQSTAIISNNIANINTTGFKRSEAAFESLVTSQSATTAYSPGTVLVNRLQAVTEQGGIQQTASTTDAAVSGSGMFAVKREPNDDQEFLYTRAGQFSEDRAGLLRNASGFVLYGWPVDENGNLPANQGDLTSLQPVDVAFIGGLTNPTSTAELAVNLNAEQPDETLSNAVTGAIDFSRGITVFDSLGAEQVLTFNFTKTYGPQATAGGTRSGIFATDGLVENLGANDGDTITISSEISGPSTFTIVANNIVPDPALNEVRTVNDLIERINEETLGVTAFLGNDGEFVIQRDEFVDGATNEFTLTQGGTTGSSLDNLGLGIVPANGSLTFNSDDLTAVDASGDEIYDNGAPGDVAGDYSAGSADGNTFPAFNFLPANGAAYNSRGWWQLDILLPNGTSHSRGMLNFNGDGTLNAGPDITGNVDINLTQIDWGNGSDIQEIDIDIERFTQFAGNNNVIFSDQNGAEVGLRSGIDIDREGFVTARFSNGASRQLYKVPLVTFPNFNGLDEVSGTAYSENSNSGEETLREAGTGGSGFIEPAALEQSNVDLANEFAELIVSQRAYGAGTRVITTIDQMTEELLRLR